MKKRSVWICLFLLLCVCPAAAQEYTVTKSGEKKFEPLYKWGAYSGSEFSLGIGAVRSGADDRAGRDYTSPGVIGNASILVDMSPHVASGIDYMYGGFRSSGTAPEYSLYSHHISAAFKIRANPDGKLRVYFPLGAGGGGLFLKKRRGAADARTERWGLALYAGAGLEFDISPVAFLGAEYRYVYTFVQGGDLDEACGSNKYFGSHALMLKIGMRMF